MLDEKRPSKLEQVLFYLKALFILGPAGAYRQYKAVKLASKPGVRIYVKSIRKGD